MGGRSDVTTLLRQWAGGDAGALDELTPLVYEELRTLARRITAGERPGHTLQPTALVNEVFTKLVEADVTWQNRAHFFALCARMMRRLLVNHAEARRADRRGGGAVRVEFDEMALPGTDDPDEDLLALHQALAQLAEIDPRKAELLELQYFAGLTFGEMEQVTGLSSSTLDRDLRLARAWMKDRLARR
jgi:RNA polymerase sigma-70 factor, ECF subfamily